MGYMEPDAWDPEADLTSWSPKLQGLRLAISEAARDGEEQLLENLLDKWEQQGEKVAGGVFSLEIGEAAINGHRRVARLLNRRGVLVRGHSAAIAAQGGNAEALSMMLDFGWHIDGDCDFAPIRGPALSHAILTNQLNLIERLLDAGADPNVEDMHQRTPFTRAILIGSIEACTLIRNGGGDVEKGHLMHHAVLRKDELADEIRSSLVSMGAPLNRLMYEDTPGKMYTMIDELPTPVGTPLHHAVQAGNRSAVEFLLRNRVRSRARKVDHRFPEDLLMDKPEIAALFR